MDRRLSEALFNMNRRHFLLGQLQGLVSPHWRISWGRI